MKKTGAVALAVLMMGSNVLAADINVRLNDEAVSFDNQQPVIYEGRTLVPLRGVFEKLGYEITWDNGEKTAEFVKAGTVVKVKANADKFTVNGTDITLEVPAKIINGSMMLPLRAIGEATGLEVIWDTDTKTVNLSDASEPNSETITEDKNNYDSSEHNERVLSEKEAAQFFLNVISVSSMLDDMKSRDEYYMEKIKGARKFSYSDSELKSIINSASNCFECFALSGGELNTGSLDKIMVKKYVSAAYSYSKFYDFLYDSLCTSKYEALSDSEYKAKYKGATDAVEAAVTAAKAEVDRALDEVNAPYGEFDEEQSEEKKAYIEEVRNFVKENAEFMYDLSSVSDKPYAFNFAANSIKQKINSMDTPKDCVLEKEIMLLCCDLMENAGKALRNGAFDSNYVNKEYVDFLCSVYTINSAFFSFFEYDYEKTPEHNIDNIEENFI